MKGKPSLSTPVPLQILRPDQVDENGDEGYRFTNGELQIVDPITPIANTPFELPSGWVVKRRKRKASTGQVDRYYYEPGTGQMFRSMKSVQRHLAGEPVSTKKRSSVSLRRKKQSSKSDSAKKQSSKSDSAKKQSSKSDSAKKQIASSSNTSLQKRSVPLNFRSSSSFKLPDDWIVEEIPRKNVNYSHISDKYYTEPGSGNRFRSLVAVERYLAGESPATPNALEWSNHSTKKKKSAKTRSLEIILKQPTDDTNDSTGEPTDDSNDSIGEPTDDENDTAIPLEPEHNFETSKADGSENKNGCCNEVKDPMLDFSSPPAKIKWVLCNPGENAWNSYMSESVVPKSVQQIWSETFVESVQDKL